MAKTHFKKAFNTPYLGSHDLPEYKDVNLTIAKVESKMSEGLKENETFNIAYWTDKKVKPMLLNATNCRRIQNLADGSPYLEDWVGIEVTVYVQTGVKAFGSTHDALRIREVTKKKTKIKLNPQSDKWTQAIESVKNGTTRQNIEKYYDISDANWTKLKNLADAK